MFLFGCSYLVASAHPLVFVYADAPLDRAGFREQPKATDAAIADLILPHLKKLVDDGNLVDQDS